MSKQDLFLRMKSAIIEGKKQEAISLAQESVERNLDPSEVIEKGYIPGIQEVGNLWENGEYFLPELITSAECMKAAMDVLQPELAKRGMTASSVGKVVIGTIQGDIHDIGKNLVASMLAANGFEVFDLGVDVKLEDFVDKAVEEEADFICLSALLTTTMAEQKKLIELLKERKLYGRFNVMVGGAPTNRRWADEIGADGYAENAMAAVSEAKNLLKKETSQ